MVALAKFLAVPAKELVCLDAGRAGSRDLRVRGGLRSLVGLRVTFFLLTEAQPQQDPQSVGIERQDGRASREEENLLCARLADRRKLPESPDRVLGLAAHGSVEIAVKVLERDRRDGSKLFYGLGRYDPRSRNFSQGRGGRLEDFFRREADTVSQPPEGLVAPL